MTMMIDQLPNTRSLASISLVEVVASAALLERTDRKYLVRSDHVGQLLSDLPSAYRVLEVDGRRSTTYRTTYFDSENLRSARDHIQGRRRRFKVRTRLYVEDEFCRVEVKTRGNRGQTVKVVREIDAMHRRHLNVEHLSFIADELDRANIRLNRPLLPSLDVNYRRTTLVDTAGGTRLTIDGSLNSVRDGREVRLDDDWLIVEIKSRGRAGRVDEQLRHMGHRPLSFSKYVAAVAALHDDIPSNHIRRLLGTQLHLEDHVA